MLAETGMAGPIDFKAAAASYKRAAELGHISAQVRYGFALLHGRGVEPDPFTAETWLRRAALAGDAQAAAVIGYIYARDGELPPNHAEAAIWFERAASGGHVSAARILGSHAPVRRRHPQRPVSEPRTGCASPLTRATKPPAPT